MFITGRRVPHPHDCPALLSEMCVSIHCDKISGKKESRRGGISSACVSEGSVHGQLLFLGLL